MLQLRFSGCNPLRTLNYDNFLNANHEASLRNWLETILPTIQQQSDPSRHGHFPGWLRALHSLPPVETSAKHSIEAKIKEARLTENIVATGTTTPDAKTHDTIKSALMQLRPWRKGPFCVDGVFVDSEWKSFLKWNRIAKHISPLDGRSVLDVGCGNGYYGFRMLGAGAKTVVGIDPGELFCTQFAAINHFINANATTVLPLTGEMVFEQPYQFDTVFSLGVLSHRRAPDQHLIGLLSCVKPGGELVLETLVIDSKDLYELIPTDRYANMRNVWKLPNVENLVQQVKNAGFTNVRCVDVTRTTPEEQRSTEWMPSYSLQNALDPTDPGKTIEGYPAPTRAILIANR